MDGVSVMPSIGVEICALGAAKCSDSDRESVVSDYSEMADPVMEHLASIHLLQEAELRYGSVLGLPVQQPYGMRPWLAVQRRPDEDEIEFLQRQRKMNFLSLAQEFAAIKMANPDALPFNLHRHRDDDSHKEKVDEESDEISLAEEISALSFVDKTDDDDVSPLGASDSEQVQSSSGFHSTTKDGHISHSSNIVTNSCSASNPCAVEEVHNTETDLMVSSVPDVVRGLHSSTFCGTSKQPDVNSVEIDPVVGCHLSSVSTHCEDEFKASCESSNALTSQSKNMLSVSIIMPP